MKQPDTLIQAMQNGDEKALGQIYTMYSEAVYGISYSIVGKETIAQELVQDVFIKIWNNCGAYSKKKGRFFTWVLNITRNTAIDMLRSKGFKTSRKNLNAMDFVHVLTSNENLNRKTDAIGIQKFVEKLRPACQKIIDILFFKGYTQSDAAKELGMPLGTLKTRNRKCLQDLRSIVLN